LERVLLSAVTALLAVAAAPALAQTCTFNNNQPNTASFGTIDPTLATPRTFTITLNYKCTGNPVPSFTITGSNDSGPGAYRLQNLAKPAQYMRYTISTSDTPGSKLTLDGLLIAADYQNAWVGSYTDTINVLVLP
jgi:spore coat protein U-like protein